MADTDTPDTPAPADGKKKAAKKGVDRQKILVITGIVGVILTFILVRRSANASSPATAATGDASTGGFAGAATYAPSGYGQGSGYKGDGGDAYGGYSRSILLELNQLEHNVAAYPGNATQMAHLRSEYEKRYKAQLARYEAQKKRYETLENKYHHKKTITKGKKTGSTV